MRPSADRALAVVVALMLSTAACSDDAGDSPDERPSQLSSSSSAPPPQPEERAAPLSIRLTPPVRGELTDQSRSDLRAGLRDAIETWMGGFDAGIDISAAFAAYTPGAAALAREQATVTTTANLDPELVEVVPTRRSAKVAVLAAGGGAVGASADVLLVVVGAAADGTSLELVVRADLQLTPTAKGWKVFGFELARNQGAPGSYAAAVRRQREQRAQQVPKPGSKPRAQEQGSRR
jgi:hypothetical protein